MFYAARKHINIDIRTFISPVYQDASLVIFIIGGEISLEMSECDTLDISTLLDLPSQLFVVLTFCNQICNFKY
jgi:hypothetical protein